VIAVSVLFTNLEIAISYGLAFAQEGNLAFQMQEHKSNKSTVGDSSHKIYSYHLQVIVEGLDQQPTYVHSYAHTPDGISIANGTEFNPSGLETKTITVGLRCAHNSSVSQFYTSLIPKCMNIH
jgi:hypothetical protein